MPVVDTTRIAFDHAATNRARLDPLQTIFRKAGAGNGAGGAPPVCAGFVTTMLRNPSCAFAATVTLNVSS